MSRTISTLVVGVGNTILSDDGVGVVVAHELWARGVPEDVKVVELGTAGMEMLDLLEGCERLIVIDAITTGAPPGTLHRLRGDEMARAAHLGKGHDADLPTTLWLGEKLLGKRMPHDVVVVAIEAADLTTFSTELTAEVAAAVPEALKIVDSLLGNH